jgi:glycosyltransferase involved in cell wall biosynthesis
LDDVKTNILGLFPEFENGSVGGIQVGGAIACRGIQELAEKEGLKTALFSYPDLSGKTRKDKFNHTLGSIRKFRRIFSIFCKNRKPRLVLVWHIDLLKLLPFFRIGDAKVVLCLQGIEAWRKQKFLTKHFLKRVDLFLSISNHTWNRFIQSNPGLKDVKHKTIHLGMNTPIESSSPRPISPPVLLMLSRLTRCENYKGHREIIQVWSKVRGELPHAQLWIAGEGDLREDLEAIARECNLTESIRFWGNVSDETKSELLSQCRALAMPSRSEGFGLVYLEAMRMGRPCLVSPLDAGLEVVNPPEAGLAADPRDPHQLTEAICHLLRFGSDWEDWSLKSQHRYESYFTENHFHARLLQVLSPWIK